MRVRACTGANFARLFGSRFDHYLHQCLGDAGTSESDHVRGTYAEGHPWRRTGGFSKRSSLKPARPPLEGRTRHGIPDRSTPEAGPGEPSE
jgi:hypothetical protein